MNIIGSIGCSNKLNQSLFKFKNNLEERREMSEPIFDVEFLTNNKYVLLIVITFVHNFILCVC